MDSVHWPYYRERRSDRELPVIAELRRPVLNAGELFAYVGAGAAWASLVGPWSAVALTSSLIATTFVGWHGQAERFAVALLVAVTVAVLGVGRQAVPAAAPHAVAPSTSGGSRGSMWVGRPDSGQLSEDGTALLVSRNLHWLDASRPPAALSAIHPTLATFDVWTYRAEPFVAMVGLADSWGAVRPSMWREDASPSLVYVDGRTGTARPLASLRGVLLASCQPDGRLLVLANAREPDPRPPAVLGPVPLNPWRLMIVDPRTEAVDLDVPAGAVMALADAVGHTWGQSTFAGEFIDLGSSPRPDWSVAPNGDWVALHSVRGVAVYDLGGSRAPRVLDQIPGPDATAMAWSHDGRTLAVTSRQGWLVHLIDPVTGVARAVFSAPHGVHALAFCPEGRRLACAGDDWITVIDLDAQGQPHPENRVQVRASSGSELRGPSELLFARDGRTLYARASDWEAEPVEWNLGSGAGLRPMRAYVTARAAELGENAAAQPLRPGNRSPRLDPR